MDQQQRPKSEDVPITKPVAEDRSIQPTDAISEAARKILFHQFEVMLKQAAKIQSDEGEKAEAVHDMRVAIRRIRSAIRLLGMYYKKDTALNRHRKTLKQLGIVLGNVRDLTVFIDGLDTFVKTLPANDEAVESNVDETKAPDVDNQAWRAQLNSDLQHALKALEKFLNGGRYATMVEDLRAFLTTPGAGSRTIEETQSYQVRHVLPPLIYMDYTTVRAYETVLDNASLNTLHALRIACKRLRYTLEFFSDVLDNDVQQVIDATKMMQDYLGQIQDMQVHRELLEDYAKHARNRQTLALLLKYLETSELAKDELRTNIPTAWQTFTASAIRQALAHAIAAL